MLAARGRLSPKDCRGRCSGCGSPYRRWRRRWSRGRRRSPAPRQPPLSSSPWARPVSRGTRAGGSASRRPVPGTPPRPGLAGAAGRSLVRAREGPWRRAGRVRGRRPCLRPPRAPRTRRRAARNSATVTPVNGRVRDSRATWSETPSPGEAWRPAPSHPDAPGCRRMATKERSSTCPPDPATPPRPPFARQPFPQAGRVEARQRWPILAGVPQPQGLHSAPVSRLGSASGGGASEGRRVEMGGRTAFTLQQGVARG
jgi:hypothetical protein